MCVPPALRQAPQASRSHCRRHGALCDPSCYPPLAQIHDRPRNRGNSSSISSALSAARDCRLTTTTVRSSSPRHIIRPSAPRIRRATGKERPVLPPLAHDGRTSAPRACPAFRRGLRVWRRAGRCRHFGCAGGAQTAIRQRGEPRGAELAEGQRPASDLLLRPSARLEAARGRRGGATQRL